MSALVIDSVSKTYQSSSGEEVLALRGISLTIEQGECVAIIGESGSGKSTMARLVMGLEAPTTGRVSVAGSDPMTVARSVSSHGSAIVLQDPSDAIDPRMSVEAIVGEPLKVRRTKLSRSEIRERVARSLERVGLDESFLDRRPNQLSGGQQQRVGIARALVRDPSFLVLDEPTSALDPSVQAQVMRLIDDLRARLGISSLLITHDLAVAAYLADRIVVLRYGRVVEMGTSAQIWENPQHPYTRALLDAASYVPVESIPSDLPADSPAWQCMFFDVWNGRSAHPCSGTTDEEMLELEPGHRVAQNCGVSHAPIVA